MSTISRRQLIVQGSAAIAATALWLRAARSEPVEVDLALVLAVDVSRSISADEHRIQCQGYAAAFRGADVISAIASGAEAAIAVTLLEWANTSFGVQAVGWTIIRDADSTEGFAAAVETIPYRPEKGTSIGGAIIAGTRLLSRMPYLTSRRVIDVSGDGESLDPELLMAARQSAITKGITINGLP